MTKEELKQKAEEWVKEKIKEKSFGHFPIDCIEAYLAGAEPREKQIEIDAEQIRALQKQNGELTDNVRNLETQFEQLQKINKEQKETLKKVRIALIQERTANIMNYGKGRVEVFDSMFEILKGVSN